VWHNNTQCSQEYIFCFIILVGKDQNLSKTMSSLPTDECGSKEARAQGCFQYLLININNVLLTVFLMFQELT